MLQVRMGRLPYAGQKEGVIKMQVDPVIFEDGTAFWPLYDDYDTVYACVTILENGEEGATLECNYCNWEGCPMRGGRIGR